MSGHDDTRSARTESTHALDTRSDNNARVKGHVVSAGARTTSVGDDERARIGSAEVKDVNDDEAGTGATSSASPPIDNRMTMAGINSEGAEPAPPWGPFNAPEHVGMTGGEERSTFRDASEAVSHDAADAPIPHSAFPPAPDDLGDNGREFWQSMSRYEFRPDEFELLKEFARTVDDLAILRAALADSGPLVEGSKGQPRPNPLLAEMRGCRQLLIRLAYQLGIPDDNEQPMATPHSRRLARAANERWRRAWSQEAQQ